MGRPADLFPLFPPSREAAAPLCHVLNAEGYSGVQPLYVLNEEAQQGPGWVPDSILPCLPGWPAQKCALRLSGTHQSFSEDAAHKTQYTAPSSCCPTVGIKVSDGLLCPVKSYQILSS